MKPSVSWIVTSLFIFFFGSSLILTGCSSSPDKTSGIPSRIQSPPENSGPNLSRLLVDPIQAEDNLASQKMAEDFVQKYRAQLKFEMAPIPHRLLLPQDSQLVIHGGSGADQSTLIPTIIQLEHLLAKFPELAPSLSTLLNLTSTENIDQLLGILPDSKANLSKSDIGNYRATVSVRRMFVVRSPLPRVLRDAHADQPAAQEDQLLISLCQTIVEELGHPLHPEDLTTLKSHFQKFFRFEGSLEQKLLKFLVHLETSLLLPGTPEVKHFKNAIHALIVEETFFQNFQKSLDRSPSKMGLAVKVIENLKIEVHQVILHHLRNKAPIETTLIAIKEKIENLHPSYQEPASIKNLVARRIHFHSSNAIYRMLFDRQFIDILIGINSNLFLVDKAELIFVQSFIDVAMNKVGSYQERAQALEQLIDSLKGMTYPDPVTKPNGGPPGNELIFYPSLFVTDPVPPYAFPEEIKKAVGIWLSFHPIPFGEGDGEVAQILKAQELRLQQEFTTGSQPYPNYGGYFSQSTFDANNANASKHPIQLIDPTSDHLRLSAIACLSDWEVNQFFQIFVNRQDLQFNYPQNGCYDRAHIMSDYLAKFGIESIKVFSYATGGSALSARTTNDPSGSVAWTYHVAPVVLVADSNGNCNVGNWDSYRVIDPSLNLQRVMSVREWFGIQLPQGAINNNSDLHPYFRNDLRSRTITTPTYFFQFAHRMTVAPNYATVPNTPSYTGSYVTYDHDLHVSRNEQIKVGGYLVIANTVKAFLQRKGLWAQ